ncbi:hypothetical protein [Photobacterium profundum]|uniref:Uncharacterized protein n=1 Tax=Photobacterium profundum 3TCK TaxID=314280 RepID=Q1YVW2_9GAMM|nr:hypothetical protein [Photobacterium profundum]EAS40427.1 hypothetical protein P3TCK_18930 [Photobacterium profundum 3TCK]
MNIERLLAKFNLKGINYKPSQGGKAVLSLEEQLAIVEGITCRFSFVVCEISVG